LTKPVSESDFYSFAGSKGTVTIEVLSQILKHRFANPIDAVLRVYDSSGDKIAYYDGQLGAFNDDGFERPDAILLDLQLPADGLYIVEVDTFNFEIPEFGQYLPGFDVGGFCAANPSD